jgi:hypothetical protein
MDVGVLHRTERVLALDLLGPEAFESLLHDEALDLAVGLVLGENDGQIGEGGIADPPLAAVEDPVITVEAGGGLQPARDIGATVRFGQAERADLLHSTHGRQPPFALLLGAENRDTAHRQRTVHAEHRSRRRIDPRELHFEPAGEQLARGLAITECVTETGDFEFGDLRHQVHRRGGLLPELVRPRRDLVLQEPTGTQDHLDLGVVEHALIPVEIGFEKVRRQWSEGLVLAHVRLLRLAPPSGTAIGLLPATRDSHAWARDRRPVSGAVRRRGSPVRPRPPFPW